ncbi:pentapeptide repeat-containing protein [Sneathiella litorea]|uniref:Pentapeptide repeat-containing protein n=1 Tax=Sneathiella litorea TaxID=2606216 RepID=A0A6L8WAH5_9PROT|nr:pentapeptide repeat-containing protein [Sneathiella litorea]MZR31975.1 pentapeptide repeat-containing protein [Sneathiella litorea]
MSDEKPTLLDWLHINREPDFSKARGLGGIVSGSLFVVAFLSVLIFFAGLISILLSFFGTGPFMDEPTSQAIRNVGLVLAALVGLPFIVWRSIVAQKQVNVAEQSQITDRINKAVEGLGAEKTVKENFEIPLPNEELASGPAFVEQKFDKKAFERTVPNLEVRIGAIYALERIAKDSLRDHLQIMEILCAYIRENSPLDNFEPSESLSDIKKPRVDIQAAITVIGRREKKQLKLEESKKFRLDLRGSNLSHIDFSKGDFSAANISFCKIENGNFSDSNLSGTLFFSTLLNYSEFFNSKLWATRFDGAMINRPITKPGAWIPSINVADYRGISIMGADFSSVPYLGPKQKLNLIFGSRDTLLNANYRFDVNEYEEQIAQLDVLMSNGEDEKAKEIDKKISKKFQFRSWSTADSKDPASHGAYRSFLKKLEITNWPYLDD